MSENNEKLGRADLHMHTTASDGKLPVEMLLDYIATHRPHLDVIAITDHDRIDAALWAYEHRSRYPFEIIPGIEITSRAGHILALWVTQPIPAHMTLEDTITAVHDAGGMAILAHPFHFHMSLVWQNARRYFMHPEVLLQAGLDGLEAHNAGILTPGANLIARAVARKIGIAITGSSDAHTPGAVGSGITRFPGTTAQDLRQALAAAKTTAEGRSWPVKDYFGYLQNERKRMATRSLEKRSSSLLMDS